MGGVNPMPTIAEKGPIFLKFDQHYADAGHRFEMLVTLRGLADGADGVATGVSKGLIEALVEQRHLFLHWLGQPWTQNGQNDAANPWFRKITIPTIDKGGGKSIYDPTGSGGIASLTDDELKAGANQIREGIIEALEVSLGVAGPVGVTLPPVYKNAAGAVLSLAAIAANPAILDRDRSLDIYWICGKSDGFETIVSWNLKQVTVLITTPPTYWAACPVVPATRSRTAAKTSDAIGMIVVRPDTAVGKDPKNDYGAQWDLERRP